MGHDVRGTGSASGAAGDPGRSDGIAGSAAAGDAAAGTLGQTNPPASAHAEGAASPADDRLDDFARGLRNRRAVLGDAWVEQSTARATAFNADFQSLITQYAWHSIWGRPGLDHTTRRLLVLGMTMAQARWEEFELHCRAAIQHGVSLELIKETLMQGAIYCGVPAANTAFKLTQDILRAEGRLPEPQPLTPGPRVALHHTFSQPQLKVAVQGRSDASALPIVLSHALGLDLHMWDALAARLGADHAVLRYDHRGHGGSTVPPGPYTMDQLVDDAARVIREWGRGPVVWVGLSLGGMVGQGLAIRHPELVRGAVFANTTSRYPEAARALWGERIARVQEGGIDAIATMVMERYFHPGFRAARPDVVAGFRRTLLASDRAGYVASAQAVAGVDWTDRLAAVRCPTLVIAGADDAGAPVEMSEAIASRVPGAELEVLPEASHLSVIEQPERFAAAVQAFLARLAA
ncbi:alpha/beta fold hydrolase [Piscinibacter koreensis]|uniref:Alpha/beta fold hydrolase n=1 Tax=Piscinibacter koreensis TaxID=2742824 RepID=A0A7Y6NP42_9BURK|nr:alpha/beta fold hydrolase [Schlegelella koreensis]NUZ06766.1 alpha/beta fold hydrolase [Schlegelella koreensis]